MDYMKIRLGEQYWCVLKTTLVDENKKDKPEFLVHLAVGFVTSKGLQLGDDGIELIPFVEMCGQRLKADMVFEDFEDAAKKMYAMMDEIKRGTTNTVPPEA